MSDWLILRTSGRHTMGLAESLAKDGFDAWTPVETKRISVPGMTANRTIRVPLLPSYVFARARHLVELLQLADMPVKPRRGAGLLEPAHAGFSVLHAFGRIPMVADRHLNELRRLEAKRTPREKALRAFKPDVRARAREGAFGGMVGVVVKSTPSKTTLLFNNGRMKTELPTSLLDPESDLAAAA